MTDIPTLIRDGRALLKTGAARPWTANHDHTHIAFRPNPNGSLGDYHYAKIHGWSGETAANGKLILFAVNNLPALLDALEAAQARCSELGSALQKLEQHVNAETVTLEVHDAVCAELAAAREVCEALACATEVLRLYADRLPGVMGDRARDVLAEIDAPHLGPTNTPTSTSQP